jgi:hypothetical protein
MKAGKKCDRENTKEFFLIIGALESNGNLNYLQV